MQILQPSDMTAANRFTGEWVSMNPLQGITLNAITQSEDLLVAVGSAGAIRISRDGERWQVVPSPVQVDWRDVTWSGRRFVAVGANVVIVSEDGLHWRQVHQGEPMVEFAEICWNGRFFLILGEYPFGYNLPPGENIDWYFRNHIDHLNFILTSSNGLSWQQPEIPQFHSNSTLPPISHSISVIPYNDQYYAWGINRANLLIIRSADDWESFSLNELPIRCVHQRENIFYAITVQDIISTATITYYVRGMMQTRIKHTETVNYVSERIISTFFSNDGRNWQLTENTIPDIPYALLGTPDQLPAENSLLYFPYRPLPPAPISNPVEKKVLKDGIAYRVANGVLEKSGDGQKWENLLHLFHHDLHDVLWTGQQFVAAGDHSILQSSDGCRWSAVTLPEETLRWRRIIQVDGNIFVFGDSGVVALSEDGDNWRVLTAVGDNTLAGKILDDVIWDGKRFCALWGGYGYTSTDALSWNLQSKLIVSESPLDNSSSSRDPSNNLAWNGEVYVSDYSHYLLHGRDFHEWTEDRNGLELSWWWWGVFVGASEGTLYLVSNNTLSTSLDGVTWQNEASYYPKEFSGIAMCRGIPEPILLVNYQRAPHLCYFDFAEQQWTFSALPPWQYDLRAIATNGTTYVAVGKSGSILTYLPPEPEHSEDQWSFQAAGTMFASPTLLPLADRQLIVVGDESGVLHALAADTGERVWEVDLPGGTISTAAVLSLGESDALFIATDQGYILRYDCHDGIVPVWQVQLTTKRITSSPALGPDDALYIGDDDGYFTALRQSNGEKLWQTFLGGRLYSSPIVHPNGRIYAGSGNGGFYCLDGKSGEVVWSALPGAEIHASPLLVGLQQIAVAGMDGTLRLYDAANGRLLWTTQLEGWMLASPIQAGELLIGSTLTGRVCGVRARDGVIEWSYECGCPIYGTPAASPDGRLYLPTIDGRLVELDGATGALLSSRICGGELYASPLLGVGMVCLATTNGRIFSIPIENRHLQRQGSHRFRNGPLSSGNSGYFSAWTASWWVDHYWKWDVDFGWVCDWFAPWTYFPDLGWAETYGSPDDLFLRLPGQGWAWTSRQFQPFIYDLSTGQPISASLPKP